MMLRERFVPYQLVGKVMVLKESGMCRYITLDELFEKFDAISLHCPSPPKNHNLINKNTINLMRDGVFIINIARG